jgi:hypothetical protein
MPQTRPPRVRPQVLDLPVSRMIAFVSSPSALSDTIWSCLAETGGRHGFVFYRTALASSA